MGSYSDSVDVTTSATPLAETTEANIKIPGGAKIIEIQATNLLGTGSPVAIRLKAPGLKTPQKYGFNQTEVLHGTEVGSGSIATNPIKLDVTLPEKLSEIGLFPTASVASQTLTIFIKWIAP